MSSQGELRVYSAQEIEDRLKEMPGWSFEGGFIVREYSTKNWKETVSRCEL